MIGTHEGYIKTTELLRGFPEQEVLYILTQEKKSVDSRSKEEGWVSCRFSYAQGGKRDDSYWSIWPNLENVNVCMHWYGCVYKKSCILKSHGDLMAENKHYTVTNYCLVSERTVVLGHWNAFIQQGASIAGSQVSGTMATWGQHGHQKWDGTKALGAKNTCDPDIVCKCLSIQFWKVLLCVTL